MFFTDKSNSKANACGHFRPKAFLSIIVSLALSVAACGSSNSDSESRRLPTDTKVIADVTPADTENVIDVDVVKGRPGESYLHRGDLVWYFDRGVVIKCKGGLAEAPDALLVVGGLARYQLVGDRYEYARFLTTYNEYEGIPAPSENELTSYVDENLKQVFVSRDHNIIEISSIRPKADTPWIWHAPTSFTVPFRISYKHRTSNTTVEERDDLFDVRFYKKTIDDPIHALTATEKSRAVVGKRTLAADAIDRMKTLRTDFK